jgi:hypothetical protein
MSRFEMSYSVNTSEHEHARFAVHIFERLVVR